jgi:hypothetical protein
MKTEVKIKERLRYFLYTLLAVFKMRKWSNWIDTGTFEVSGRYYLMQMRYDKETNLKQFKRRKMGWVNDYMNAPKIFENTLKYNAES